MGDNHQDRNDPELSETLNHDPRRRQFLRNSAGVGLGFVGSTILGACSGSSDVDAQDNDDDMGMDGSEAPMMIATQGSFAAGGKVLGDIQTSSLSCDHGFVEYQIPHNARAVNLLMWHSSSVAVWQNRWDGGEGYQSIFLRRQYPVYLWDGPRVGRANWGAEEYTYEPSVGQDQGNFIAWRFGVEYPNFFEGLQFPTDDPTDEAFNQAVRARYQEFDTVENAQLQSDAGAEAVERMGPTVALTNSAGGFRALLTALKSDKVAGIVAYENPGYVFPEGQGPTPNPDGPFGPISVSPEEFKKLTEIPIQFVWGDNIDTSPFWAASLEQCNQFVDLINANGGNAEILELPQAGLRGNTHIAMADMNNLQVADLLSEFLQKNGLDGYA